MRPKTMFALAAAVVLAAAVSACGSDGTDQAASEIRIGAMLSLSGNSAFAGVEQERGMRLAVKEVNASRTPGERTLALEVVDDASDPNQAVQEFRSLAVDDDIVAIAGGDVSSVTQAVVPLAKTEQVPFVITNSFTAGLTRDNEYAYQMSQPTSGYQRQLVDGAVPALGLTRAAIIYANDNPTTQQIRDDFRAAFERRGVEIVVDEGTRMDQPTHTPQLQKARDAGADVLVTGYIGTVNAGLVLEARRAGYQPKAVFGHVGDITDEYFEIAQAAAIGTFHTTPFVPTAQVPEVTRFVQAYQAEYQQPPSLNAAEAYQSVKYLALGIAAAGATVDRSTLQQGLGGVQEFPSVLGSTGKATMDADRVARYAGLIVRTDEHGQFVPWAPQQ